MKTMVVTVLALVVCAATAGAGGFDLPHGKWWENERVVERVGLTADQQRAISDLVHDHARRMIDLNAELKKAELELSSRVDRDEFDPAAVRKAFAEFQAARQRLEKERFEMLLAVRGEVTARQWDELVEIRRFLDRSRDERRPGGAPPGGGGMRPDRGGRRPPADGAWN